jgi:3D (Asp-Asp-Asp) domain-containing protein
MQKDLQFSLRWMNGILFLLLSGLITMSIVVANINQELKSVESKKKTVENRLESTKSLLQETENMLETTTDKMVELQNNNKELLQKKETLKQEKEALREQLRNKTEEARKLKEAKATPASSMPSRGVPSTGKTLKMEATAYTAYCNGCSGTTRTGINLRANPNAKVIAVDPNVIPLGSKVYVEGYGYAIAADTGSAIKGGIIDVFIPNKSDAYKWGRKNVTVKVLES